MTLRTQASLGKGLKEVEKDDFNMNNLFLATITKVNYKYQTVELRTKYTYAGRNIGSKGEFSAPFPKSFIGRTPEGALFGDNNIIVPGSIALVGFLEGDAGQPFIINVYGYPNDNKMLTPNPLESGDINNRDIYKYGSMIHQINPSLTYSYLDGEGTFIKSFNGKSFISITSQEDERPLATDFYTGTEYEDLYTSYYGDGSEVEPRNQIAPNVLLKHRGEYTHDGEEDNHITTLHLTEKGAVRVSVMNTETQERTTQEMDENGNYRVIYQGDELLLDEAQVWVEYGINKDTKSFYIKNENQEFEFTDEGVLINGTPLIENLDESLQEAFEKLKVIQKDLEDINSLLEGAGKENLEELIRTAKDSIEASGQASRDVEKLRGDISTVSQRVEGNIKKLDDYMKTMDDFVKDTNNFITEYTGSLDNVKRDVNSIKDRIKNQYIIGDDSPTSNFTTRFQNTLNEIRDNGGGTLYVLPGNYEIKSRIKIYDNTTIIMTNQTKLLRCHNGGFFDNGDPNNNVGGYDGVSNITIIGGTLDNNYENIDKYPTKQINMIALRHAKNITIKDLTFRNGITVHCVDMNGSKDVMFDGCRFEGYVNLNNASYKEALQISEYVTGGIDGGIFDGTPCKNITVKNCTFSSSDILGGYDVCIGNHISANNVFNSNIKVYNNTFKDCNIAIRDWKWNDLDIHGNTFINNKECLRASSIGSSYESAKNIDGTPSNQSQATRNLIFNENKIYNFTSVGIGIYGIQDNDTALIENVKIRDNYIKGSGQGIISSLVKDIVIEGNDIEDTYRAIKYSATKNIRVLNNTISNSKTEAIFGDVSNYGEVHSINYNSIIKHNIIDSTQKNSIFISTGDIINITDNVITNSNMINEENNRRGSIKVDYSDKVIISNNSLYGQTEIFAIQATTSTNVISNNNNTNIQE